MRKSRQENDKAENPKLPLNYRGITICNSIGKVFNSILNNRLDKFLIENNIIHENQIEFSKKSRTSDHIFVLKCIIEKYLKTDTKKLCVCFVDFHKTFDTVIHPGIRYKLIEMVYMDYSIR
jgi:chromosome segregation ATPase